MSREQVSKLSEYQNYSQKFLRLKEKGYRNFYPLTPENIVIFNVSQIEHLIYSLLTNCY
ncbi:hypothetical protein OCHUTO_0653 [Orientia chuto str. Dubai]|uniref:Uncharacterized protein n=1 Tax=Orientia chuto str. Dubai TaxID=1359168 RepID=A0A0F3MKC9_9RICK|nr:hypothetical protein [Candidatus Orientia mediorientalis]KJV55932.1 hypothetical protein OCHUTO_0653 [Orientia chuto str. Dubai]